MKKDILILGHNGMLGQMAAKYFSVQGYNVICYERRFTIDNYHSFFDDLASYPDAIVINAIGKIKQKTNQLEDLVWANATLPLALSRYLLPTQFLIHPTSDCVFSGQQGHYAATDNPDAIDEYGWSKRLGELAILYRANTLLIRSSFIGTIPDRNSSGLLDWFLSQPVDSCLNGYTNHLWNGITTLEWCKTAEQLVINTTPQKTGLIQVSTSEFYSKYELLKLLREVFEHNISIRPYETEYKVDRTLISEIGIKPLSMQLKELREFTENRGKDGK